MKLDVAYMYVIWNRKTYLSEASLVREGICMFSSKSSVNLTSALVEVVNGY